ncbi:hypothetical protein FRB94_007533 [Tulasnella sp. JGI-2019a]|nr:hypothetical protein FRB94_007533 [Tulasnella sp. JGI-2019a]KAG9016081.1 hypothetical protein FRB93_011555 [Tulasnella sp. JGI-2019a]KAG9028889.1 hypothetical protein FRB95_005939 [Tulasnella sp. JGI-2019a]
MPIGGFLKASWDHLPKAPRLPPSFFSLKTRKAWLAMQPTFTYGDERDRIQKDKARQAKKQLARDEAWAKHEKKKQERAKKREQAKKEKDAKRAAALKAKASGSSSRPTTTKPKPVTRSNTMPAVKTRPSATVPHRTQSMNTKKVVYTVVPQAGVGRSATTGHRSRPAVVTTQSSRAPAPRRATAPVQPWGPIRTATHTSPVATSKPRVVRAQTYPTRRP